MTTSPPTTSSNGALDDDGRIQVLVVDDNGGVRMLLRKLAERDTGVRFVAEAGDGMEAIEMAATYQPDVVILDVDMPVLDGIGAIAGILRAAPNARILMHSAFNNERDRALASGAHGWANKGQSWDEIRRLIADLLAV